MTPPDEYEDLELELEEEEGLGERQPNACSLDDEECESCQ